MIKPLVSSLTFFKQARLLKNAFKVSQRPARNCVYGLYNHLYIHLARAQYSSTTFKVSNVKFNWNKNDDIDSHDPNEHSKEKIISRMNFLNPEHAKPFYKLPMKTLIHIYQTTKNDNKNGFCSNRLYFMTEKMQTVQLWNSLPRSLRESKLVASFKAKLLKQCSPTDLSERLAKRTFIYSLSFEWLKNSLTMLLNMGVSSDRILRDLWVLKYKHETIHERLQRVKDLGIETLYPWMVRCNQNILDRYITIFKETKSILGDNKSTIVYLADRLNTTPEAIEEMCLRIPALKTIRVTKVKHFVDYLISEGYQPEDIANKPRVLLASPKTIKLRLEKLRKIGLTHINLNLLCKSRKDFKKYHESMETIFTENKN